MEKMKKILSTVLVFVLVFGLLVITQPDAQVNAASKKAALSKTKATLIVGDSLTLTVKNVDSKQIKSTKWSTSNKAVATVSSKGVVKAVKAGTAVISSKLTYTDGNTATLKCTITVKKRVAATKISISGITLNKNKELELTVGEKVSVTAKLSPAKATDKVFWYSDNAKVATVTSDGIVKGVKAGNCVITAKAGLNNTDAKNSKVIAKVKIKVNKFAVEKLDKLVSDADEAASNAYGGVIIVLQNGKIGARDYYGKWIVKPGNYSTSMVGGADGFFLLYDGKVHVFNAKGKEVVTANDAIVSENLIITYDGYYEGEDERLFLVYHHYDLNGKMIKEYMIDVDGWGPGLIGSYQGKTIFNTGYTLDIISAEVINGKLNYKVEKSQKIVNNEGQNSTWGRSFEGPFNHGYSLAVLDGGITLVSDDFIESNVYHWSDSYINEQRIDWDNLQKFFYNGDYYVNYGSKVVLKMDDKYYLLDISKETIVQGDYSWVKYEYPQVIASYDYLDMSFENHWLVKSDGKWGYTDINGKIEKLYDDASAYYNGYAVVVEKGEAWVIDDDFVKIKSLGKASGVSLAGEVFKITKANGTVEYYRVK